MCIAKSYRNVIYERFRYKNTKSYLKNNGYTIEEAAELSGKINSASCVYDKLGLICGNLLQCPDIDITRLSLNQLYLAKNLSWCYNYEQILKRPSSKPDEDQLQYSEADFQDFLNLTRNHPVFTSINRDEDHGFGRRSVSALFLRVSNVLNRR